VHNFLVILNRRCYGNEIDERTCIVLQYLLVQIAFSDHFLPVRCVVCYFLLMC